MTSGATTCTITDLIPGTSYSFVTVAKNGVGPSITSPGSPTVRVTIPAPATPHIASVIRAGDGKLAVTLAEQPATAVQSLPTSLLPNRLAEPARLPLRQAPVSSRV